MIRILALFLLGFALALLVDTARSEIVPPRPEQPHPDVFPSGGSANLQEFNPVTVKAKAERTVNYRLLTMPGCVAGTVPSDMAQIEAELEDVAFNLDRNDSIFDFTVRVNCGSEQIRICGSINIFCLGRGFPFNADVEISDVISTFPTSTRLSILCHEICGHAVQTANEQYCLGTETTGICAGLSRFTPAPNWPDFMNTGPLSRHLFEEIELERWERIMYELVEEPPPDPCAGPTDVFGNRWDNCLQRWIAPSGWRYDPNTGIWELPDGSWEWSACEPWQGRFNFYKGIWMNVGHGFYAPERNLWSFAPLC